MSFRAKYILMGRIFLIVAAQLMASELWAFDEFADFSDAKNAFEAGEYKTAVERFEQFLSKSPTNGVLTVDSHKYLGVCYLFLGNKENAEEQFVKLLNLEPDYSLDPLVFPIDVVDFFSDIKREQADRLEKLAAERAREEEERRLAEIEQKKLEMERLTRTVYLQRTIQQRSRLVAYMPLGAGQFQNGHKTKGFLFLGGELLLGAAAITTYALHESLRDRSTEPFYSSDVRRETEGFEKGYRIANHISLAALGITIVAGIVDSLYHFTPRQESWQTIEENEVPSRLRQKNLPQTIVSPFAGPNTFGIQATGTFR